MNYCRRRAVMEFLIDWVRRVSGVRVIQEGQGQCDVVSKERRARAILSRCPRKERQEQYQVVVQGKKGKGNVKSWSKSPGKRGQGKVKADLHFKI